MRGLFIPFSAVQAGVANGESEKGLVMAEVIEKTEQEMPLDAFRRSAGFQIMFVLHSGMPIAQAIDHLCASAEKMSAALRQWQPIETAPKTGEEVLLWAGKQQSSGVIQGKWMLDGELSERRAGWYWASYGGAPVGPIPATHWMPLPDPPTVED